MEIKKLVLTLFCVFRADAFVIDKDNRTTVISETVQSDQNYELDQYKEENAANVFSGVYTECFLYLSYSCLQKKTLLYLKELDKLSEVSVIGEYVKFVKVNETENEDNETPESIPSSKNSEELSFMIDKAVDKFFNNHILKFKALGKDIAIPSTVDKFVGRKRKGGGGGGGGGHGGHGGDDGGKKKMMMMAMMCMKMKLMMMVPAMMGMMGMMSFKGMMFSMMSFMISKMMLLMKILEKKGGGGGGGSGGDGGWAAGGGGGGAWMPAGGQDGGGGGGGYDANAQWQSRSIFNNLPEAHEHDIEHNLPIITYVKPVVRFNNNINGRKPYSILKKLNDEVIKINQEEKIKSRKKRGIVDVLQNAYAYWINRMLGLNSLKYYPKFLKYKVINGVKYVYYPIRHIQKVKSPKELINNDIKVSNSGYQPIVTSEDFKPNDSGFHPIVTSSEDFKPIIVTAEDFNKGEIVEGPVESRGLKKKIKDINKTVNEVIEDNPWQ